MDSPLVRNQALMGSNHLIIDVPDTQDSRSTGVSPSEWRFLSDRLVDSTSVVLFTTSHQTGVITTKKNNALVIVLG